MTSRLLQAFESLVKTRPAMRKIDAAFPRFVFRHAFASDRFDFLTARSRPFEHDTVEIYLTRPASQLGTEQRKICLRLWMHAPPSLFLHTSLFALFAFETSRRFCLCHFASPITAVRRALSSEMSSNAALDQQSGIFASGVISRRRFVVSTCNARPVSPYITHGQTIRMGRTTSRRVSLYRSRHVCVAWSRVVWLFCCLCSTVWVSRVQQGDRFCDTRVVCAAP